MTGSRSPDWPSSIHEAVIQIMVLSCDPSDIPTTDVADGFHGMEAEGGHRGWTCFPELVELAAATQSGCESRFYRQFRDGKFEITHSHSGSHCTNRSAYGSFSQLEILHPAPDVVAR